MLPVIQSLWIGNPLSQLEKLCVRSFLHHGHAFHLYVYDDVPGVPDGATVKDANEILPESEIFWRKDDGRIAPFSDWFRYALLAKNGNFWVDMDTICIAPFDFPEEIVFGTVVGESAYSISVMQFSKGHECMLAMEKSCRNYGEEMPWDDAADKAAKLKIRRRGADKTAVDYVGFGSPVFTKAVRYFGIEKYAKPYMYFYPHDLPMHMHIFDRSYAKGIRLHPDTYAVHIANTFLDGLPGFDKNASFDSGSLYEQLKAKYGMAPTPNARKFDQAAVHSAFALLEAEKNSRRKRSRKKRAVWALALLSALCTASFFSGWLLS